MNILQKPECIITFKEVEKRHRHKIINYKKGANSFRYPTFFNDEDVEGYIDIKLNKNQTIEHNGIRAELHGIIEQFGKINSNTNEILNLGCEIARQGEISQNSSKYSFSFKNTMFKYESYKGINVSLKYFIKIIINSNIKNFIYEKEFAVAIPNDSSILYENDGMIKMSVGLKNLLDLDFIIEHSNYNCRGTLKGFVTFSNIQLNLKYMEIELIKKEIILNNVNKKIEDTTIENFELIDGSPYKDEKIPFRFFLGGYNLTPTYSNVNNIFSVKYYINLIIGDYAGNQFFKEREIKLFRLFGTKKTKNKELMYGPFEEFITEPMYNEEYYSEDENKENEQIEEGEEEEEEQDDDENNINTNSKNNENDNNRKNSIVHILRANSIYHGSKEIGINDYNNDDNYFMRKNRSMTFQNNNRTNDNNYYYNNSINNSDNNEDEDINTNSVITNNSPFIIDTSSNSNRQRDFKDTFMKGRILDNDSDF